MAKKVVIIGGVAAGMKTASRLRRRDKDAEITVLLIHRRGLHVMRNFLKM